MIIFLMFQIKLILLNDIEIINTELELADIETLETKNIFRKKGKQGDKEIKNQINIVKKLLDNLNDSNYS